MIILVLVHFDRLSHPYEGFHKCGVPQNGWFIKEIPTQVDDLGAPLFLKTTILISEELEAAKTWSCYYDSPWRHPLGRWDESHCPCGYGQVHARLHMIKRDTYRMGP